MAEQDPATSTVRPNVWVLFVLQFLASETAMIGRQYQISPECNSNLRSLNKNEIFTFHFLSDRDMGNCNVGWSIRSHPSLYELSRSFFQSIGIGIENFGLGVKVKTSLTSYSPDLLDGDEIVSSKTGGKKLAVNQICRAAVLIVQRSSSREWDVDITFCNVFLRVYIKLTTFCNVFYGVV